MLDEYEPYLRDRWNCRCADATALWRELRGLGYPGGYSRFRDYLAWFREAVSCRPALLATPPEPHGVISWIMTGPATSAVTTRTASARSCLAEPDGRTRVGTGTGP